MDMDALSHLMGEDLSAASYADIWVCAPDPADLALVGEARRLADSLGCYVHAVLADGDLAERAIAVGADRVHVVSRPGEFLLAQHPEFALFPVAKAHAAARAAQHHRAGLISDARFLSVDDTTRALLGAYPVYGGDYLVEAAITSPAKFATLDPRQLPEPYADTGRSGEVVADDFSAPEPLVRNAGPVDYTPAAWRPLQKARRIVAVGRGLKDAAGFALAQQLAEKLGAEIAGDRSAEDMGWIGEERVVGLTGQEVGPDLYLAFGVRGDTLHNAAIVRAKHVVAVHANPAAPLLAVADEAVAGDPAAVLRQLLERLG
ncbi:MAG: electron transfer flavoprotein subunit alpha/FixB family protein [Anaerolineales bacterium]|nr:electron transfer flavoprotein subunit alpha/FixB family protein [Anaerolineales bacterium]